MCLKWVHDKLITDTEPLILSDLFPQIVQWAVFARSAPEGEEDDSETLQEKMEVTYYT